MARIAPSPDWFVGLSGFALRPGGQWVTGTVIDLYPWDAGTENGSEFTNNNATTVPQAAVSSLRDTGLLSDNPIARIRLDLRHPPRVQGLSAEPADGRMDISWEPTAGASSYKVQWKSGSETFADAASDGRQHVVDGNQSASHTILNLRNGTEYRVRVIATNAVGDGRASREATATPTDPAAGDASLGALSLSDDAGVPSL